MHPVCVNVSAVNSRIPQCVCCCAQARKIARLRAVAADPGKALSALQAEEEVAAALVRVVLSVLWTYALCWLVYCGSKLN